METNPSSNQFLPEYQEWSKIALRVLQEQCKGYENAAPQDEIIRKIDLSLRATNPNAKIDHPKAATFRKAMECIKRRGLHLQQQSQVVLSCPNGYFVPTCIADFEKHAAYIQSKIAPMVENLELVQAFIKKQSEPPTAVDSNQQGLLFGFEPTKPKNSFNSKNY